MKLLLDTHALFWALVEPDNLAADTRLALEDPANQVFATLASAQELAMKLSANQWPEAKGLLQDFERLVVEDAGFFLLAPTATDYLNMTRLPTVNGHKDPMDRLIIAMAIARGLTLVSSDNNTPNYAVEWITAGKSNGSGSPRQKERIIPVEPLTPIPTIGLEIS
ncbi:type II toxin-antitoxin system VapC family toxin [Nitrospirillum sp. BR 11828]|uniref:type II toxin-antitoxin system VapC family toxin n=1 Tax=Nitrospirillum sp. BR 11828 TaxID=3104325 RepID=UPI002ACA5C69|nr:type II toxin-antitoxin system VapC family toxin [Nitrospirillum sp. BR 11828]MDZ5650250.1 type II toxin-antitoxin system VapC family toxin [Nitrospirillum sp. BR 11828]